MRAPNKISYQKSVRISLHPPAMAQRASTRAQQPCPLQPKDELGQQTASVTPVCGAWRSDLGHKVVIESEHIFHVFSLKLGPAFAGPFFMEN